MKENILRQDDVSIILFNGIPSFLWPLILNKGVCDIVIFLFENERFDDSEL